MLLVSCEVFKKVNSQRPKGKAKSQDSISNPSNLWLLMNHVYSSLNLPSTPSMEEDWDISEQIIMGGRYCNCAIHLFLYCRTEDTKQGALLYPAIVAFLVFAFK